SSLNSLARALNAGGRRDQGREALTTAQQHWDQLITDPRAHEYKYLAAINLHDLARMELEDKKLPDAVRLLDRAITLQRQAREKEPGNPAYLKWLISHLTLRGNVQVDLKQPD